MHLVANSTGKMQRVLTFSLAATFCYVVATFYFGLRAHSLALISEAGHNVSDMLAIAALLRRRLLPAPPRDRPEDLRLPARRSPRRLRQRAHSHRPRRLDRRLRRPSPLRARSPSSPALMMYVAAAGVLMNGAIAALLWKFSGDVNIRSVLLHMLGDTLSTAAVIAGGAAILFTGAHVDRPRALHHHRRHDPLELALHRPRDPQHPARRHAPAHLPPRDPHRHRQTPRRRSTSTTSTSGRSARLPRARQPRHHRRTCRSSECARILDADQLRPARPLPRPHTTIQFEIRGCETTHGCSAPPPLEDAHVHDHHHHHGHTHAH